MVLGIVSPTVVENYARITAPKADIVHQPDSLNFFSFRQTDMVHQRRFAKRTWSINGDKYMYNYKIYDNVMSQNYLVYNGWPNGQSPSTAYQT